MVRRPVRAASKIFRKESKQSDLCNRQVSDFSPGSPSVFGALLSSLRSSLQSARGEEIKKKCLLLTCGYFSTK